MITKMNDKLFLILVGPYLSSKLCVYCTCIKTINTLICSVYRICENGHISSETKRNKQCYYGWLYLSTDSSKLMTIRDWAALLNPSPRRVNTPAPLSLHHSSPQRSLLRSVLESLCSCSSCLFLSRVFNQIASTTNLLSLPYST